MNKETKEYLEKQEFNYDHFTKLTSTGIIPDYDNIIRFATDFTQSLKDEIVKLEADLLETIKMLHKAEKSK